MDSEGKNQRKSMPRRWIRIWTQGLSKNVWEWPGYITRVFLLPLQGRRPRKPGRGEPEKALHGFFVFRRIHVLSIV